VTDEDAQQDPPAGGEPSPADEALVGVGDNDAIFEALWKRAIEAWDDDKPHAALLDHALRTEKLPDLAGRYRALKDDPAKGARAQKKIDGIVVAATQMLMATKTPPRTKTPWQWTASAAFFFALACAWIFYELFLPHHR
jgi:hypothetical protein